jgi:hypothetical protein
MSGLTTLWEQDLQTANIALVALTDPGALKALMKENQALKRVCHHAGGLSCNHGGSDRRAGASGSEDDTMQDGQNKEQDGAGQPLSKLAAPSSSTLTSWSAGPGTTWRRLCFFMAFSMLWTIMECSTLTYHEQMDMLFYNTVLVQCTDNWATAEILKQFLANH